MHCIYIKDNTLILTLKGKKNRTIAKIIEDACWRQGREAFKHREAK